jgi:hypothetical protein
MPNRFPKAAKMPGNSKDIIPRPKTDIHLKPATKKKIAAVTHSIDSVKNDARRSKVQNTATRLRRDNQ